MAGEVAHHQHKEERHEEDGQHGSTDHPPHHAGTDGITAAGAGAGADHQRQHPEDKGKRSHQDRAQTQTGCLHHRLTQAHPLVIELFGKFHDQDRVLRRQADGGEQTNLKVDVVLQSAKGGSHNGPQNPERYYQHHRERNAPALVEGRQTEEHHQQGDGVERGRL